MKFIDYFRPVHIPHFFWNVSFIHLYPTYQIILGFLKDLQIYTERKKKHHFFRAMLTNIHHSKMNHIWTNISFNPKKTGGIVAPLPHDYFCDKFLMLTDLTVLFHDYLLWSIAHLLKTKFANIWYTVTKLCNIFYVHCSFYMIYLQILWKKCFLL